MSKVTLESFEFTREDRGAVVAAMSELAGGGGWVTIDPAIRDEHTPPEQSPLGRLFTNRGPWVPRATWVPADVDRRRPEPVSIGILHAAGPKALAQLADKGLDLPDRWRKMSDHPKRGLVLYVPIDVGNDDIVEWLLVAVGHLTKVPLLPSFRATIHRT